MPARSPVDFARNQFLRLPARARRLLLNAAGKRAPWDPHFDFRPPTYGPDLAPGPPDFVGVGVQKAGTTWWFSVIEQHRQVYSHPGIHKERHFFDRFWDGSFHQGEVLLYHAWFPRPVGRVTGEWTPDYSAHYWIPPLLWTSAPGAKILFLLRDPVERYRSALSHHLAMGDRITPTLASDAFTRGLYRMPITRYEELFGPDRVLVLQFEACRDEPQRELQRTLEFLGLEAACQPDFSDPEKKNTSQKRLQLRQHDKDELVERYRDDVLELVSHHPEIDIGRWPNFATRL